METVKGCDNNSIIEAFSIATGGEFVEHKSIPNCKILNKFPNIVLRTVHGKETIEYPYLLSNSFNIMANQKKPCYKIAWTLNTNGDDTN